MGHQGSGYWQAQNAAGDAQIIQAKRTAEQALLLARGWKERAERAEAALAVDRAIEQLTSELNQGNP